MAVSAARRSFRRRRCIDFLLRAQHLLERSSAAATWLWNTLEKMARGGIYDQIGGGFHRYCGRRRLAGAAFREDALRQRAARARPISMPTRSPATRLYRRMAEQTLDYVLREMTAGGRVLRHAGRRQRRGRGQVLRLDAGRDPGRAFSGGRRDRRVVLRRPGGWELRGRIHLDDYRGSRGIYRRAGAHPETALRCPIPPRLARPRRKDHHELERHDDPRPRRGRTGPGPAGLYRRGANLRLISAPGCRCRWCAAPQLWRRIGAHPCLPGGLCPAR